MIRKINFTAILILWSLSIYAQTSQLQEVIKLKNTSVKDQEQIGSCWAFATVAMIETDLLNLKNIDIDLSENYCLFYGYINKAKIYLMLDGKHNFGEGGQAHDVMNVIREYGIVPEDAYPYNLSTHSEMVEQLKMYLDSILKFDTIPLDWEKGFVDLLIQNMGKPPETFQYDNKTYTPKTFADQYLDINPDDYIEFASFLHHKFYDDFVLEVPDNWSLGEYYNVPLTDLLDIIKTTLKNGYAVDWDGDVSNKGFAPREGYADYFDAFKSKYSQMNDQQYRQQLFLQKITTDDHLMLFSGLYTDRDGLNYFYTKNSWGVFGKFDGYLYMSEDFVKYQTVAIMINKNALNPQIRKKFNMF